MFVHHPNTMVVFQTILRWEIEGFVVLVVFAVKVVVVDEQAWARRLEWSLW